MYVNSKSSVLLMFLFKFALFEEVEELIENHLGTKSPYSIIGNRNVEKPYYGGCSPIKIWMLTRHGTRDPSEDVIEGMKTRLPQIKGLILKSENVKLTNSNIKRFQKWKPKKMEKQKEKYLTPEGAEEMTVIAERMQARFPDVLQGVYSNSSYKFKYTATERAKKSAKNFVIGLFGKKTAKDVWYPEPSKSDPILRFYKGCPKWYKEVKDNPASSTEKEKFQTTNIVLDSIRSIESKLGLKENTLNYDDVSLIYTTCAFETAWDRKKGSPWCSAFDLSTIKIFEYADDLKHYWLDGYGYNITYRQACTTFGNMIDFHERKELMPKAVLYFTHSGTLLKVLSHLGLYKDDEPLKHDKIDPERKWRVSKIDSFATNLAFLSYQCGSDIKLLMLHQESIVRFPCCPDEDLCPISQIKSYYEESISHCNFEEICSV